MVGVAEGATQRQSYLATIARHNCCFRDPAPQPGPHHSYMQCRALQLTCRPADLHVGHLSHPQLPAIAPKQCCGLLLMLDMCRQPWCITGLRMMFKPLWLRVRGGWQQWWQLAAVAVAAVEAGSGSVLTCYCPHPAQSCSASALAAVSTTSGAHGAGAV